MKIGIVIVMKAIQKDVLSAIMGAGKNTIEYLKSNSGNNGGMGNISENTVNPSVNHTI